MVLQSDIQLQLQMWSLTASAMAKLNMRSWFSRSGILHMF